ncbi:MAG: NAD(P)/FAD-dependent oxidoreductase [Fluviibacter sp.]
MKIIVIGAGIAGLSCATALKAKNHQVTIFDKSRGPSGRMSTRRGDGWQCDHGAQYFTARESLFKDEVERWRLAGAVSTWNPKIVVFGNEEEHKSHNILTRYVGTPRMTSPAKWLSESLEIRLAHTINSISHDDQGWRVITKEHGLIDEVYDALVMAVPAPQATPLLKGIEHSFSEYTQKVKMVGSWTLMLRFAQKIDIGFDAAFVNDGPLRWVARDSSKPGRIDNETWVLQASASWSESHIETTAEEVIPALIKPFVALGGSIPESSIAHKWRYADTPLSMIDKFLWDKSYKLGVCGDWINGGKVEGAWMSGHLLAQAIP